MFFVHTHGILVQIVAFQFRHPLGTYGASHELATGGLLVLQVKTCMSLVKYDLQRISPRIFTRLVSNHSIQSERQHS